MLDGYQPGDPVVRVFAYQANPRAAGGGDRRRGVRHLQRPPQRPRRRGPGLRLLRARAPFAVIPRNLAVLQQVVLPSLSARVPGGRRGRRASRRLVSVASLQAPRSGFAVSQPASDRMIPSPRPSSRVAIPSTVALPACDVETPSVGHRSSGEGTGQKSHRERCIRR